MVLLQALNDTIGGGGKADKVCEQGHSLIHWYFQVLDSHTICMPSSPTFVHSISFQNNRKSL